MPDNFLISRRNFMIMPACLAALSACKLGSSSSVLKVAGLTMGTNYSIVAVDHTQALSEEQLRKDIDSALVQVNTQLSNWDPASEISRFNASTSTDSVTVSPALAEVMNAANSVHTASDGQFDVTLGPLIDLWGFGSVGNTAQTPTAEAIETALRASGQSRTLRVSDQSLQKQTPETEIYLSAIGKGYGVDVIARKLESHGIKDFMVEIGGDLYTAGLNPDGTPWQIGIETPDAHDRTMQEVVGLSNLGMATSGDYRNYFEQDGVRYSHIIDAQTGRPITHTTASVTVLTENAMLADAWATAMLVLGKERGLEIANNLDMAVLFIERDNNATRTKFITTPSTRFSDMQA
ncbi:FAD:protein FMN transferase [Kiloniella sp.]|uniref:FAD:protein FMN transferase n=1 Tax=Kiloniella sp. TaxID=1938587 RepID=UPI003A92F59A